MVHGTHLTQTRLVQNPGLCNRCCVSSNYVLMNAFLSIEFITRSFGVSFSVDDQALPHLKNHLRFYHHINSPSVIL